MPKGTDFGSWQKTFVGTGPFKLKSYSQNQGAVFVPNPNYWGPKPYLDVVNFKFYQSQQPQILALQGNDVDCIAQFTPSGAEAILNNSQYTIIKLKSSNHRELSMRCDQAPFTDPRVRQAVALTFNRPAMVQALLHGLGTVANDHPFAPMFKSSDLSVPQRTQDIAKAKQLMAAAGHVGLLRQGGVRQLRLAGQHDEPGQLRDARRAQVFLNAPLTTKGAWNAAHFHNKRYDQLFRQYTAALDLQTQKGDRRQDRAAAARRDAADHPLLDRRPDGVHAQRPWAQPDGALAAVPRPGLQKLAPVRGRRPPRSGGRARGAAGRAVPRG